MAKKELAGLIEEAARLAEKAPKHLQEAAFNQAFRALQGDTDEGPPPRRPRSRTRRARGDANDGDSGGAAERFVGEISRTDHPEVGRASRLADKAMLILDIANDKLGADGLTPAEISDILSKKFRLAGRPNSIRMALVRETESVDDREGRFHIMAGGEERVAELRNPTASGAVPRKKSRSKSTSKRQAASKKASSRKKKTSPKAPAKKAGKKAAARRGGSSKGPKAAINDAISAGFFDKARTASEIQTHLGRKKAHHFTGEQIRVALLRLVRDEDLERDGNADGQYEYQKP